MPGASVPLPFLEPPPTQTPLVDPSTGMLTANWTPWFLKLYTYVFGVWRDVVFDAANFTTNIPAITWTVAAANVRRLQTFQMGEFAVVIIEIISSAVSADVDTLYVRIPTLKLKNTGASIASALVPFLYTAGGATLIVGVADVNNEPGTSNCRIELMQLAGTDFLAADDHAVFVVLTFPCQSVTTP